MFSNSCDFYVADFCSATDTTHQTVLALHFPYCRIINIILKYFNDTTVDNVTLLAFPTPVTKTNARPDPGASLLYRKKKYLFELL